MSGTPAHTRVHGALARWGGDEGAYAAAFSQAGRPVVAGKSRGDWGDVAASNIPDPDGNMSRARITATERVEIERLFRQFGGANNPPRLCEDIAAAMVPPRSRRAVADALETLGLRRKGAKRGRS